MKAHPFPSRHGAYRRYELSEVAGLSQAAIDDLIRFECFPPIRCFRGFGYGWNKRRLDAWVWGLGHAPRLARAVEAILGYRDPGWAS